MSASIYIIEDHPVFCEGVVSLIQRAPDLEVCGSAQRAAKAREEIAARNPDLILVDIGLHDESGLGLIQQIKASRPKQKILALSGLDASLYAVRSIRAGAAGFLMKSEASSALLAAIHAVLKGQLYLNERLSQKMIARGLGLEETCADPLGTFTDRELEVFRLIGTGATVRQIAENLYLSPKTIETYRANIKEKLGLETSRDVLRHATAWRIDQFRSRRSPRSEPALEAVD